MDAKPQHVWGKGDAYEPYVGRWSRLVAREFLAWLNVEPGQRWLDVGCGTGALSETILQHADPLEVHGIDPSESFIALARQQISDQRASFTLGDARQIAAESAAFAVVVSGLVLNFIPDLEAALKELARVTQPGGLIAAYVWDYAGKMELMRYFWDAVVALKPQDRSYDEGVRFPMCRPESLQALFADAGLRSVETRLFDVETHFRDFDDYWQPFLSGQFPAPDYAMALNEADRAALRERIRAALPFAADGSIPLIGRAWAVRGIRT
jgi:trans-aconitate methyltransferase